MDIEVHDLRKAFGAVRALDGISLSLPAGSRVALVGPNGAGKSTLTRALLGMVACEGEIRIGGLSPFADRVALARRLAYVPQQAPRLAASVGEIVAAVTALRGIRPEAVDAMAARLDLEVRAVRAKPFRDLSGGMKQKLLNALAFAAAAALYVLDEPTASLDTATRGRFFALVDSLPRDATVLLCSHRAEEIRRMTTRVVALEEGRVRYDGPIEGAPIERAREDARIDLEAVT